MAAVKSISKLSGQAKSNTYPQPEGVLGDCMLTYGKKLGEDSLFGQALVEMGESLKQMADVKYSLDDNIKQNFLEPLHHLQTKDLKEVMVGNSEILSPMFAEEIHFYSTIGKSYKVAGWISIAREGAKPKVWMFCFKRYMFLMHVCMCLVSRGSLSPYGSPLRGQGQQGMNKATLYASVLF